MADVASSRRPGFVLGRGGLVKICGLREPEHAAAAAGAGADLLGFIFAPARRQVTTGTARECVQAAREVRRDRVVIAVGVFVDATVGEISAIVDEAGLDAVQLHGCESPEMLQELPVPAIKVLRPEPRETRQIVLAEIDRFRSAAVAPIAFTIEGASERGAGGTGTRADWELAADIAAQHSILLGGGLGPENVGVAIARVRPAGVDVSSGVETNGVKDIARIEAFIAAARQAFQAQDRRR